MNKKAQGISINIVIVAAVALLVLVILSVIFMGRMGTFSATSKDCVAQGGKCFVKTDGCGSGTTPGDNASSPSLIFLGRTGNTAPTISFGLFKN